MLTHQNAGKSARQLGFPLGYVITANKAEPEPAIALENFGAAGAMYSTAGDLATFALALTGNKLLSPESTKAMLTADDKLGYVALGAWVFPLQIKGSKAGQQSPPKMLAREGEIGSFKLSLIADTHQPRVVVLMTNQTPNPVLPAWEQRGLMYDLLNVWYGEDSSSSAGGGATPARSYNASS